MSPRRVVQRLLALGRSRQLDTELDGEIAAHLELAERDLVASGVAPAEARRIARQRFGGVEPIKEAHRDSRSARWIELWWHDLRLGVRGLRRAPAFCAAAVLILGLSIGANTTMFSAVRAILLQPLGYADPDRLVVVLHGAEHRGVGADAQAEDQDRGGARPASAPQPADAGPEVVPPRFDPARAAAVAVRLLDGFDAAEALARGPPGLLGGQTGGEQIAFRQLEVRGDFGVELGVQPAGAAEGE